MIIYLPWKTEIFHSENILYKARLNKKLIVIPAVMHLQKDGWKKY